MFLKRLTAIIVALILLVQFSACKQNPQSENEGYTSTNSIGIGNDITSSSIIQDNSDTQKNDVEDDKQAEDSSKNSSQDNSSDKVNNEDITTSENQNVDNTQQDSKDEINSNDNALECSHGDEDPYQNISKAEFYANYTTACCNQDATYRSKHGFLSGSLEVPGQYAEESTNRPVAEDKFIRNTATVYLDNGNTYVVIDASGNEVMRIHKAGGYITLEEVAAYMYAFGGDGTIPANYTSKKKGKPNSSIWGEYLRVNHSYFMGDTDKYPYEPELPDISGCGGSLRYYEMDIGTTGTETPGYAAKPYIQGNKINRGAARLVYARQDLNGNGIYENNEVYVFYTHNHYNDFREYLNYYGGWGEMFGNVTGGGEYSSKTNANPTPYVPTAYADFLQ